MLAETKKSELSRGAKMCAVLAKFLLVEMISGIKQALSSEVGCVVVVFPCCVVPYDRNRAR